MTTWLADVEMTMLTTTGAKTGRPRTHVVLGLPDGERIVVVASNYGRPNHPARYYNLKADPRASIELGGVVRDVIAHQVHGVEREQYFQYGVDVYPGFTLYQHRANREIPVLAFDPAP